MTVFADFLTDAAQRYVPPTDAKLFATVLTQERALSLFERSYPGPLMSEQSPPIWLSTVHLRLIDDALHCQLHKCLCFPGLDEMR